MKRVVTIGLAVFMVAILFVVGCAQPAPAPKPTPSPTPAPAPAPAKVIELKFSHHNPPSGRTTVKFLDPWTKNVEVATKGAVKITAYPAESLAKSKENIEAVTGGIADIAWLNMGNWTGRFPLTEVINLPFMLLPSGNLNGKPVSNGVVNSHIIQELYDTFPEMQAEFKDMKVLFLHTSDPYFLASTKKQVRNLNDTKGFKLRAFGKGPTEMWKLLGAAPVALAMPDVYEAADKGVIDGMGVPWAAVATYKFYEVFRYYTDVATDIAAFAMVMNKDKWNSLPADVQKAIMSVSGIAGAEFAGDAGYGASVAEEVMATMTKVGKVMEKVSLDPGELEKWKAVAGKPLWDQWVKDTSAKGPSQKILDTTLQLLDKYK